MLRSPDLEAAVQLVWLILHIFVYFPCSFTPSSHSLFSAGSGALLPMLGFLLIIRNLFTGKDLRLMPRKKASAAIRSTLFRGFSIIDTQVACHGSLIFL